MFDPVRLFSEFLLGYDSEGIAAQRWALWVSSWRCLQFQVFFLPPRKEQSYMIALFKKGDFFFREKMIARGKKKFFFVGGKKSNHPSMDGDSFYFNPPFIDFFLKEDSGTVLDVFSTNMMMVVTALFFAIIYASEVIF